MIQGVGISPGQAFAKALIFEKQPLVLPPQGAVDIEAEIAAFRRTLKQTVDETAGFYHKAKLEHAEADAAVFLAHQDILEDDYSVSVPIETDIRTGKNAAHAIYRCFQALIELFEGMDDPYMSARSSDVRDLGERLLRRHLGIFVPDLRHLDEKVIVIAREITPSDTAGMDLSQVAGFVTEVGGALSHVAIIARSRSIPAVSGVSMETLTETPVSEIWIDGSTGQVETMPTAALCKRFLENQEVERKKQNENTAFRGRETVTADGHRLRLFANIATPDEADRALRADAEGIGLFRTEFLFMNERGLPDEQQQFQAYQRVLKMMAPRPVVVRTLDIGGDKKVPALHLPEEENPFLGCRAIRLCLERPDLFRTQLRALLRASVCGNLRIMFPMISCMEEFKAARAILQEEQQALRKAGVATADHIPVGMMIEVPSAALLADKFAVEADFFSIGTNDLTQYTLAADRGNLRVMHLYNTAHPAVMTLIRHTIEAAHRHGISCGICGEAAGDPAVQPQLIRWGADELSLAADRILPCRKTISTLRYHAD